jgi:F0F1-type ATP synthase membrane subunit b/b'
MDVFDFRKKLYKRGLDAVDARQSRAQTLQEARDAERKDATAARRQMPSKPKERPEDAEDTWVQKVEMGFTHGIAAAAPAIGGALASGVKSWLEGKGFAAGVALDPMTVMTPIVGTVVSLKDKHYQIQQLSLEVNEALNYIKSVKGWIAKVDTCETDLIAIQIEDIERYIKHNFLNASSFLQRLIEADKRAMQVLKDANKDPGSTVQHLKELQSDMFLELWPDYYRTDLNARMLKLIEIVKTSMMESILRGYDPTPGPKVCAKPRVIKELQTAKEPSESSVSAFLQSSAVMATMSADHAATPSAPSAGGRKTRTRTRSQIRRPALERSQRKVHQQYF